LLAKTPDSEVQALKSFQSKGDQKALASLYKHYMPLVYGVCLKYLKDRDAAQDMVMNIYEKLVMKLADQQVDNFKSWLYVLTKNECLMHLRAVKRKIEAQSQDFSQVHMEFRIEEHHDNELESDLTKMETCIEKLKNNQKVSIKLFYLEKKCYQEVAETTGEDLKKVKSHIQNGKRNLKICIEELREREA